MKTNLDFFSRTIDQFTL